MVRSQASIVRCVHNIVALGRFTNRNRPVDCTKQHDALVASGLLPSNGAAKSKYAVITPQMVQGVRDWSQISSTARRQFFKHVSGLIEKWEFEVSIEIDKVLKGRGNKGANFTVIAICLRRLALHYRGMALRYEAFGTGQCRGYIPFSDATSSAWGLR
jgi:hypothetical protein